MQEPNIRHSYVKINNSFVHLQQYGHGESLLKTTGLPNTGHNDTQPTLTPYELSFGSANSTISNTNSGDFSSSTLINRGNSIRKKIIIFIPGNPGQIGFYHDFLSALYKTINRPSNKSGNQFTILAIGHNNFDHPDSCDYRAEERICIEENDLNFVEKSTAANREPHHVELQVLNKLIILKKLLKVSLENCHVIFIGHSIGCYIILRMLQDRAIGSVHGGSILIHPALENLALTAKGSTITRYFYYKLDLVIRSIAFMMDTILPKAAKLFITKWLCEPDFVQTSSDMVIESVAQVIDSNNLTALIQMAKSEFATVKNIDHELLIRPHVAKLRLIYALDDHWVNTENLKELREQYADLFIEEQPNKHAFVMDPTTVMDYAVRVGIFIHDFIE